jgi:hypothetical protein
MGTFISVLIAMVFSVVFLACFPSINTLIRSVPMPVGILPIVGVEVTLLPYIICGAAFLIVILIVKNKVQN